MARCRFLRSGPCSTVQGQVTLYCLRSGGKLPHVHNRSATDGTHRIIHLIILASLRAGITESIMAARKDGCISFAVQTHYASVFLVVILVILISVLMEQSISSGYIGGFHPSQDAGPRCNLIKKWTQRSTPKRGLQRDP